MSEHSKRMQWLTRMLNGVTLDEVRRWGPALAALEASALRDEKQSYEIDGGRFTPVEVPDVSGC